MSTESGLCQIGNSIYESFKAGNYIYLRNLGSEQIHLTLRIQILKLENRKYQSIYHFHLRRREGKSH